jgi:hypothetical protein
MGVPLHCYVCGGREWSLGKLSWAQESDVVMSWLRLQTRLECIPPHPCHIYTQCFSTLICRGWAYGCTLKLLRLCRLGGEFWKIGVGRSLSDAVMLWLRLQTHLESTPHPCHMYKVFQHLDMLWMGIWVHPYTVTHPTWLIIVVLCHLWSQHDVIMSWLRLTATSRYGASLGGTLCNTSKTYVWQVWLTSHESKTTQKTQLT